MKIDPKTMHSENFRPHTLVGAVAHVIDRMDVGSSVMVTDCLDRLGRRANLSAVRVCVNMAKGDRVFSVRSHPDAFAKIIRIA